MRRYAKLLALLGVMAVLSAACRRAGDTGAQQTTPPEELQRGGTLLVGLESDVDAAFDPQKEYYSVTWGFYHCCLLRTLVTTNGLSADQGGNDLVPDLAAEMPTVSEDGLTWTFRLKQGLMYAPPYDDTEIVAEHFINAMKREADPDVGAGYPFYYSVIEGFDEYGAGEADEISGMTAVDDYTLEIRTTREAGDLPYRMMMPAAAPIPTGADEGHEDDYGRFLISSGPYMFEGSDEAEKPPARPFPGYRPGRSIVLVRNPSWSQDDIRPAYVDRIEAQIGLTTEDMQNKIKAGELHINLDGVPPPQIIQEYQTDPEREQYLGSWVGDGIFYLSMNVAEPPFDDVHVRIAANFVTDKEGLLRIRGGPLFGEVAGHAITNPLTNNLLADYNPYPGPDVEAAMEHMRQSKYDTDGDGMCDAPECSGVVTATDEADPYPDQAALLQQNFGQIGIQLDVTALERTTMYDRCNDPGSHVALCAGPGWFKDYSDATTFGEPLFGSSAIGPDSCCNYALLGASPELLEEHGYETTEVPSVDSKFQECDEIPVGDERYQCWAEFDQMVMEEAVPWVPINFARDVFVWSDQVQNFVYDQFAGQPNLSQVALVGGGGA